MKISSIHYAGLANVLFENLKNPFGFVIGRADKRYTLWKYSRENDTITIAFVHVLSSSRPKIEFQFPGVYVCEELRGEHRMVIERRAVAKDAAPKTPNDTTTSVSISPIVCANSSRSTIRQGFTTRLAIISVVIPSIGNSRAGYIGNNNTSSASFNASANSSYKSRVRV